MVSIIFKAANDCSNFMSTYLLFLRFLIVKKRRGPLLGTVKSSHTFIFSSNIDPCALIAAARGAGGARQQHAAAALRPHHRAHAVGHQRQRQGQGRVRRGQDHCQDQCQDHCQDRRSRSMSKSWSFWPRSEARTGS